MNNDIESILRILQSQDSGRSSIERRSVDTAQIFDASSEQRRNMLRRLPSGQQKSTSYDGEEAARVRKALIFTQDVGEGGVLKV
jgi:hypothetical protein